MDVFDLTKFCNMSGVISVAYITEINKSQILEAKVHKNVKEKFNLDKLNQANILCSGGCIGQ
jgi:hypothetical protein